MDKKTGPATQSPSANAADDEAARLAALLFGEEAPGNTEVPSSYAARLFGEQAAGNYGVMGRLMEIKRLPVGDLGLLTVGFRITDRPGEKWTRRFNQFKYGEPTAVRAATRTFCAAFEDFLPAGDPAHRRRLLGLFRAKHCAIRHPGVDDFCTRGATLADIARAIRESNPGWKVQPASLAKAERAAYWKGELTNAHIPDFLDATWRGDPQVASPFY